VIDEETQEGSSGSEVIEVEPSAKQVRFEGVEGGSSPSIRAAVRCKAGKRGGVVKGNRAVRGGRVGRRRGVRQ
jgi:hypothetical protein